MISRARGSTWVTSVKVSLTVYLVKYYLGCTNTVAVQLLIVFPIAVFGTK